MDVQLNPNMDKLIFTLLNGRYNPDFRRVRNNLDSNEQDVQSYLGTYFPRSFAEQKVIWERLLSNNKFVNRWRLKDRIRVIDIGSGTGGNVQGILDQMMYSPLHCKPVDVWAIDGNELALEYQRYVSDYLAYCGVNWNFIPHRLPLDSALFSPELESIHQKIGDNGFDIIITSKFLCEICGLALKTGKSIHGFYESFLLWAANVLNKDGVIIVVDVVVKNGNHFSNSMLCSEWHSALLKGFGLRCILPRVCGHFQMECGIASEGCRQVSTIHVGHSQCSEDIANICFKIFTQREFAQEVLAEWGPLQEPTSLLPKNNWVCIKGRMRQSKHTNTISPFD